MKNISAKLGAVAMASAMLFGTAYAEAPQSAESTTATFTKNSQELSIDLFQAMQKNNTGRENIVMSPYSIEFILGINNNVVDDATHQTINKAWQYPATSKASVINQGLQKQLSEEKERKEREKQWNIGESYKFNVANAIYVAPKFTLSSDFKKIAKDYDAQLQTLDFTKSGSVKTVNEWVSKQTEGQIPKVVESFSNPQNMRMMLVNTVHLEARWEGEFNKKNTKNRKFYGIKKTSTIPLMQCEIGDASYYEDKSVQFVQKSLRPYNMFFILPKAKGQKALDQAIASLNSAQLNKMRKSSDTDKVKYEGEFFLPRFTASYETQDLQQDLKGVGIDFSKSNLNKATVNPKEDLTISQMIHKAVIDVNEEGVSASAVTVEPSAEAMLETRQIKKIEVKLDRPFIYGIMDYSGNILFLGTVENL